MKLFEISATPRPSVRRGSIEEIVSRIKRDCQPFLKEAKGNWLVRGISKKDSLMRTIYKDKYGVALFSIGSVRNNRTPTDNNPAIHHVLNNYFKEKTGIPVRSACLFVTGEYGAAREYGSGMAIFPIGEFHYTWSDKIADAYTSFDDSFAYTDLTSYFEKYKPMMKNFEDVKDIELKNFSATQKAELIDIVLHNENLYKFDTGLIDAMTEEPNEIMLVCDKYYAVSEESLLNEFEIDFEEFMRKYFK